MGIDYSKLINELFLKEICHKDVKRYIKNTNAEIFVDNGFICLKHPYNKVLLDQYKYLKTIKFDSIKKFFTVTNLLDYETCIFLLNINKIDQEIYWEISKDAVELIKKSLNEFKMKSDDHLKLIKIKKKKESNSDFSFLKKDLYDFQKVGVDFIEANNGIAIIGDDMGLGKSVQAIAYTAKYNLKTVVVCPQSLKYNWFDEVSKFTYKKATVLTEIPTKDIEKNELKIIIENLKNVDYVIINYDQLSKYKKILLKLRFDCVILDESQWLSSTKIDKTKNVKSIFGKVEKKILLSGTIVRNRPMELFSQLKFLKPGMFKSKEVFGLRYCDPKKNRVYIKKLDKYIEVFNYNGASNIRELYSKISTFYIRRLKKDVLSQLPEKEINYIKMDVDEKTRLAYNLVNNDLVDKYSKTKEKKDFLIKANALKHILSESKIDFIVSMVNESLDLDPDRKVIVFSQFRSVQKKLIEIFGSDRCCSILGNFSDKKRKDQENEFKTNPEKKVLVSSLISGGVGLNLVCADMVFFCDLGWTPTLHDQAEDRVMRIGQQRNVNIYYFIYNDSIEVQLLKFLEKKKDILSNIVDGSSKKIEFNEESMIYEFIEDYCKKIK